MSEGVLVLGPGRSGTSAVAGILHHLGIWMGEEFVAASEQNRYGTFEDAALFELHRAMIADRGQVGPFMAHLTERAAQHPVWGWKDPMLSYSAAFVAHSLQEAGHGVRAIITQRASEDCQASFISAYGVSEMRAAQWWCSVSGALMTTEYRMRGAGVPMLTVRFEELLADPARVVGDITDFVPGDASAEQVQAAIRHIRGQEE